MLEQSLTSCLDDINTTVESLEKQYFKPPGIFHNALIHQMITPHANDFAKILRDAKRQESSMFKVSKNILQRRDEKGSIFAYLGEQSAQIKRNRTTATDRKPIIKIPRNFYIEQQENELININKWNSLSSIITLQTSQQFNKLLKKFENYPEAKNILFSLQTGTIAVEEESVDAVISILHEINNIWPLSEFSKDIEILQEQYMTLKANYDKLADEVKLQDTQIEEQYSLFTNELIAKKQRELEKLTKDFEKKKAAIVEQ